MKLKKGVKTAGMQPEIMLAICITKDVYLKHGRELVITSIMDGKHKEGSKHYIGQAFDTRTRYFSNDDRDKVASEIAEALGDDYDVVIESTHLHIEHDPKE